MNTKPAVAERDLVIKRVFDAPRALVFQAWTDPKLLMSWWAPNGCLTPYCNVDLRQGGAFHYCMQLPDGVKIWGKGTYRDIIKSSLLVYEDAFADDKGNVVSPTHYGMSKEYPMATIVTVTFTELGSKTAVTLTNELPAEFPERKGAMQGWMEMLERLAEALARN